MLYQGEDISGASAHELVEKGIGYVPQRNNVFPSLTVEENLEMGAFLIPKQVKERIDYVIYVNEITKTICGAFNTNFMIIKCLC